MRLSLLLLAVLAADPLRAVDLVLSGGHAAPTTTEVGTPSGGQVKADSSGTMLVNFGGNFLNLGVLALGYEIPVAVGGPGRAMIHTQGLAGETYTERMNLAITPGVRVRLLPVSPLTPWFSIGAGIGRLERQGVNYGLLNPAQGVVPLASQSGDRRVFTLSTAGGVDWKLLHFLVVRGEVRNWSFTTPMVGFVGSFSFWGERRNNLTFLAGVGLRF